MRRQSLLFSEDGPQLARGRRAKRWQRRYAGSSGATLALRSSRWHSRSVASNPASEVGSPCSWTILPAKRGVAGMPLLSCHLHLDPSRRRHSTGEIWVHIQGHLPKNKIHWTSKLTEHHRVFIWPCFNSTRSRGLKTKPHIPAKKRRLLTPLQASRIRPGHLRYQCLFCVYVPFYQRCLWVSHLTLCLAPTARSRSPRRKER